MEVLVHRPEISQWGINRFVLRVGAEGLGHDCRVVEARDADALLATGLTEETPLLGPIPVAREGLKALGRAVPLMPSFPPELHAFLGRRVGESDMADLRARVSAGEAVFAKPEDSLNKLFTGRVFRRFADLIPTAGIADEVRVILSEVVAFRSEWRAFLHHGRLMSLRPYKGEPLNFPDPEVIRTAIAAWPGAPAGCSLDFGVTAEGRTLLVEANDGYALGGYGLPPMAHAALSIDRWCEIVGQPCPHLGFGQ